MKFLVLIVVLLFPIKYLFSEEKKEFKVATFKIPLMIEDKKNGRFIELFKKIEEIKNIKIKINVYPTKRTLQKFIYNEVACFFPFTDGMNLPFSFIKSDVFYIKKDYILYRSSEGNPKFKDLIGKTVGLTAGYPYPDKLISNKKINFEYAVSEEANISKLVLKRIDYFVVEYLSGIKAIKNSGLKEKVSVSKQAVGSENVYFACNDSVENKKFINRLNESLILLNRNGYLKKLFPENY